MKRFVFRLEAVRNIRDVAERRARERFGLAQQKVTAATEALRLAKSNRTQVGEALAGALTGCFRAVDQVGGMAVLREAERRELDTVRLLVEAETARERVREDWLLARRRLQVIARLEERVRHAHREAADKAEQNLLDELGCIAASRLAHLA